MARPTEFTCFFWEKPIEYHILAHTIINIFVGFYDTHTRINFTVAERKEY